MNQALYAHMNNKRKRKKKKRERSPPSPDASTTLLDFPSLQNHELNKPLFFINYPVCGIQL
jgi:hypothetical protein